MRSLHALLAMLLASLPLAARAATDYTDAWWAAGGSESGWGLNVTHQHNSLFATFYVYGQDGKAVWFTSQMNREGTSEKLSGPTYRVSGTYYGSPTWNGYTIAPVGTASFTGTSANLASLDYTIDGVRVQKSLERLRDQDPDVLARARPTSQQHRLNRAQRLHNLRGAFAVRAGARAPPRVVLVDDILTTSATLEACAAVLRAAGAERVVGVAVAREI